MSGGRRLRDRRTLDIGQAWGLNQPNLLLESGMPRRPFRVPPPPARPTVRG